MAQRKKDEEGIAFHVTEMISYGGESYLLVPPSSAELLATACCPCSDAAAKYQSARHEIEYRNSCLVPGGGVWNNWNNWTTSVDAEVVGRMEAGGYVQGRWFTPCACSGEAAMQNFFGRDGELRYIVKRKLFPCWPCFLSEGCGCLRECGKIGGDFHALSRDKPFVISTEAIFSGDGAKKAAEVELISRIECAYGCCPRRAPVRYAVRFVKAEHGDDAPMLGSIPLLYRGVPASACLSCGSGPASKLTGLALCDYGRFANSRRCSLLEMLRETSEEEAGLPTPQQMSRFPVTAA